MTPNLLHTHSPYISLYLSISLSIFLFSPMTCNGMPSTFFSPNFILQMQTPHEEQQEQHLHSLLPSSAQCSNHQQDFRGGASTMLGKRSISFPALETYEDMVIHGEEELSDDGTQAGEKKRRLTMEQVKTLEKNFELGNKLEPERKMQLARALGLQPRQIAIWFQNRRARWKTKQLEKDYDSLKKRFDAVKLENDELHTLNRKLQSEIMALKGRETPEPINLNKETDQVSSSNRSDNSSTVNLEISRTPPPPQPQPQPPPPPPEIIDDALNLNSHRPFFQQFLQDAATARPNDHQANATTRPAQDESFCSMLSALDDQSGFWSVWRDHQGFH